MKRQLINKGIFKEYDIRGRYPEEIDEEAASAIGLAFVKLKKIKKMALGWDARPESAKVAAALALGARAAGADIFSLGVCASPEMFFAVGDKKLDGGAMATASHNPSGYTGFKLCGKDGVPMGMKTGLKELIQLVKEPAHRQGRQDARNLPGKAGKMPETCLARQARCQKQEINIINDYKKFVFSFIDKKKIINLKLVLDSSGGSSGRLVEKVFDDLKVKKIKMNFRPHDEYPDHDLNPMLEENRQSIKKEVKKQQADLGLIWDGDGDRALFISEKGEFIQPYYLNCLLCSIILKKKKNLTVLIDARLPLGLAQEIKVRGGQPFVNRSGHTNILKSMKEKKLIFGCENSGHYFFDLSFFKRGNKLFSFSDGIIPALLIIEHLGVSHQTISQAIKPFMEKYHISGEINIKNVDYQKLAARIKNRYRGHKFSNLDGLSVFGTDWFINVRPSHTEPLVRVNIEGRDKKTVGKIKREILKIID